MYKVSIAILAFNKYNFTKSCLNDLSKLPLDHQIIVIDNGSTDETQKELENNSRILYHRNNTNLGFAGGSNQAYRLAEADKVIFINNDIRVKSNFEDWTKEIIEKSEEGYLVAPTMGELDSNFNFIREKNGLLTGKYTYLSGWCIAASKKIWNKLDIDGNGQIFSEEYGKAYYEDSDLSMRAKQLGIPFYIVDIPVIHFGKVSSKQLNTHQLYKNAHQIFTKKWKNKI